jgi:hypothetical protein
LLELERQRRDLVDEERPAVGQSGAAGAPLRRSAESDFFA